MHHFDYDGDGFIAENDCDDSNENINPNAIEIENNGIYDDCDGIVDIITSSNSLEIVAYKIYPNPFTDNLICQIGSKLN